jgi:hypothetical protein
MKFSIHSRLLFTTILFFCAWAVKAQEPGTIKFKKESNLLKVVFDNTDPKLFVVDRFGNPRENRILSYKLYVKTKKETKEFEGFSNALSGEMINYLNKLKSATKLFFTEIIVEDEAGHPLKLPDVIDTWFPDCKNCEPKNR